MDSMIQILEGLDVDSSGASLCACKRNLAPAATMMGAVSIESTKPASPLLAALLMFAGGFALDKVRRKG